MNLAPNALDGRLLFAVPKKGRLHEKCMQVLAGADIQFRRHARLDLCVSLNLPIALYDLKPRLTLGKHPISNHLRCSFSSVFLPAADIPSFVGKGNVDLGITGHDVILESQMKDLVSEELRLGFGKCALQVQVPEAGPFQTVEDLAGKRIVTSFEVLAGEYFEKLDEKLGLTGDQRTKIEYVGGSVEAACSLGLADGIVDLVESGDTMRAYNLHAIATVLQTEAVLIKSQKTWNPEQEKLIKLIISRIAGVITASKYVTCSYNIPREKLAIASTITPGKRAPTVSALETAGWVAVNVMVEKKKCAEVMDELERIGAEDILVFNLDNCRA
ncbi:HisG-domain-containing protein [Marasmius fiardii PR-910]|nr:HisG-domain-containing protein [Marasmius fiardii PR-910]